MEVIKMKIKRFITLTASLTIIILAILLNSTASIKASNLEGGIGQDMKNFLKADGKILRNNMGQGDVVTLRGTNIGGWQVMEAWMCPTNAPDQKTTIAQFTERFGKEKAEELIKVYEDNWWQEEDFDNIKDLNFNVIRLPISFFNLLDDEGKLREDTLAVYDWFVEESAKRDIYVILDLHAAPGSQNGRDHSGDISGSLLFNDKSYGDLTISLWEQLAQHYKGNPTIAGYGLLNEPEGNDEERAPWGPAQMPWFDQCYKAIRAIDPDHLIIFNAIWEPTNIPHPEEYGWENVMYEYHYYGWNGIDDVTSQRSFIDAKVANDDRAGHNVPVLVGEFTLFNKLPSWEYALDVFNEQGWSWTTWTYKTVEMGSWGIFNSSSSITPDVNIYNDSEETIVNKWSKVGTSQSFNKNKYIYDILKVKADPEGGNGNTRRWFQNFELGNVNLRAGTDGEAELVSSKETYTSREESQIVRLIVWEPEKIPTATSRNVAISPMVRNSVDARGLDYLIINTYGRTGNKALNVTLVDKTGATWSAYTDAAAMPMAYQWEKIFVDISKADIDLSSITQIRIGANAPGTYYFDDIYFASSYGDPKPFETKDDMEKDLGEVGTITDWDNVVGSDKDNNTDKVELKAGKILLIGTAVIGIIVGLVLMLFRKRRK